MNRVVRPVLIVFVALVAVAVGAEPAPTSGSGAIELAPSRWEVKPGAPPGVVVVLDRMKRRRESEFDAQRRFIESTETDLKARRAGRIVKELKAPDGFRAVTGRAGAREYAFQTPQIKGREVVKAEAALEGAKKRLAEIAHPEYFAKPVIGAKELEPGAAGTLTLRTVHQVSGTEAVVRVEDGSGGAPPGRKSDAGASGAGASAKELFLSDFPAAEYPPGALMPDWTIEVVGTKSFKGDNGRVKVAPHAKRLDWRQWVEAKRGSGR